LPGLQWCPNGHLDYGIGEGEGGTSLEQVLFLKLLGSQASFAKNKIKSEGEGEGEGINLPHLLLTHVEPSVQSALVVHV
jgi:hypothetical protein